MKEKSIVRASVFALALSMVAGTAYGQNQVVAQGRATVASVMADATADVSSLMRHTDLVTDVLAMLADSDRDAVPLSAVSGQFAQRAHASTNRLQAASRQVRVLKGLPAQGADVLQVRMLLPQGSRWDEFALSDYRVATVPTGEDRDAPMVRTYAADGSMQEVPIDARPAFPLLLIEVDTQTSLRDGMEVVNAGLRAQGLQSLPTPAARQGTLDVTRLDRIRLANDEEPNLKGAAEVFAIVSGLNIDQMKPEMRTFEMPWLDHDKKDYRPGQEWIHWGNYRYDVANVQLFEEDGQTNYKTMLSALISAVGSTIGTVKPTVGTVSLIADAVLQALPNAWFIDGHDYLDSFYLLHRGQTYRGQRGAAANAVVDLTPVTLGN